jgi:putative transposase
MVSPRQRRDAVSWAEATYQLSQRRACRALGVRRNLVQYVSQKPPETLLRHRLRQLASERVTFGARRLHAVLRREGSTVNHKKLRRLYVEEGLQLKPRRRRRRKAGTTREVRTVPTRPNERWAMDFMHDVLHGGTPIRIFTLVDVCTRECVALQAARSFSGQDVADLLHAAGVARGGLPEIVQCDNGTEFTSTALDHWAYWNKVRLDFSRPGKPVDNCVCEAFNGSLRRECLSVHWFADLPEAQRLLTAWQEDYNKYRPHSSLGLESPVRYASGGLYLPRATKSRK